jgi:hypothetical protein
MLKASLDGQPAKAHRLQQAPLLDVSVAALAELPSLWPEMESGMRKIPFGTIRLRGRRGFAFLLFASVGLSGPVQAQDGAKFLTLQGISSATVAPSGTGFGSITGHFLKSGPGPDTDGSMELGFGLGSAEDGVGVQVAATIASLTGGFADSGYLSLKASRRISGGTTPTYVSLEGEHLVNWGVAEAVDARGKIALTSFGLTRSAPGAESFPYMLTLGVGTDLRNGATDPGIFLGGGIGVSETTALSAAWTGETFDIGVSFRPPELRNVAFNALINDVVNSEDSRRVTVSVSWAVDDLFRR